MSKFICDICNSEFLTKPTLCKHQKTAKFCLRIKKEQNNEIVIEKNEKCIYCEEEFKSKGYLNRHYEICKVKKEKEEEKYKKNLLEKINSLENLIDLLLRESVGQIMIGKTERIKILTEVFGGTIFYQRIDSKGDYWKVMIIFPAKTNTK